jgi:hypothetical protein
LNLVDSTKIRNNRKFHKVLMTYPSIKASQSTRRCKNTQITFDVMSQKLSQLTFQVLTAAHVKITAVRDETLCSPTRGYQRFGAY